MDANGFDSLSRLLGEAPSRRGLLRGMTAAALGLAEARFPGAAGAKNKKKKCGPCQTRKHGKCKQAHDNAPCTGNGRCLNGNCNPPPTCTGQGIFNCTDSSQCCSGVCETSGGFGCAFGGEGAICHTVLDCGIVFTCVGYRCL